MGRCAFSDESWQSATHQEVVLHINFKTYESFCISTLVGNKSTYIYLYRAEIRVQFRHVPGNLYNRNTGCDLDNATNELVIRVQPDEAIYLKINNKVPGLGMRLDRSNLNLLYSAR